MHDEALLKMTNALIGYSGFVGSTLQKQCSFGLLYRSTNIGEIDGKTFDMVVCAGAPAHKWLANRNPEADLENIDGLITHLKKVRCRRFVLISTVDVFKDARDVDENSTVDENGLHAYGLHRRLLENFVTSQFSDHLIVRLPGLVGPGLRKNVIFDLLNHNNLAAIDSRSVFQFYPTVNLWSDIQCALAAGLKLVHLTAEPISVAEVASQCFNTAFDQLLNATPAHYDMRTRYAPLFAGTGHYQYNRRESIQAIRGYAQSELLTIKRDAEVTP